MILASTSSRWWWVLRVAVFSLLLFLGLYIGSIIKAYDVRTFDDAWRVVRSFFVVQEIKIYFGESQFGLASLKSSGGVIPPANVFDGNLELLANFAADSRFRRMARSVGRIDLKVEYDEVDPRTKKVERKRKVEPCSAVVVSSTLVLTAFHCTQGESAKPYHILEAVLRLGYLRDGSKETEGIGLKLNPEKIPCSSTYDCALFEIPAGEFATQAAPSGFAPARLAVADLKPERDLVVIHHPLGGTMHVTRRGCRVAAAKPGHVPMIEGGAKSFLHECGTLPGTSGAPIFDECSGDVIALHVRGDRSLIALGKNDGQGFTIGAIAEHDRSGLLKPLIQQQRSDGCGSLRSIAPG